MGPVVWHGYGTGMVLPLKIIAFRIHFFARVIMERVWHGSPNYGTAPVPYYGTGLVPYPFLGYGTGLVPYYGTGA